MYMMLMHVTTTNTWCGFPTLISHAIRSHLCILYLLICWLSKNESALNNFVYYCISYNFIEQTRPPGHSVNLSIRYCSTCHYFHQQLHWIELGNCSQNYLLIQVWSIHVNWINQMCIPTNKTGRFIHSQGKEKWSLLNPTLMAAYRNDNVELHIITFHLPLARFRAFSGRWIYLDILNTYPTHY